MDDKLKVFTEEAKVWYEFYAAMDEKIKVFAERAKVYAEKKYPGSLGKFDPNCFEFYNEKFSDLIIEECVNQYEANAPVDICTAPDYFISSGAPQPKTECQTQIIDEVIKLFAEEAKVYTEEKYPGAFRKLSQNWLEFYNQKFSDLIIEECMNQYEARSPGAPETFSEDPTKVKQRRP